MNKIVYNFQARVMYIIYNVLRFIAVHSNTHTSWELYRLWIKIGGDWAEGLACTGHICKYSDLIPDEDTYEDVNWD